MLYMKNVKNKKTFWVITSTVIAILIVVSVCLLSWHIKNIDESLANDKEKPDIINPTEEPVNANNSASKTSIKSFFNDDIVELGFLKDCTIIENDSHICIFEYDETLTQMSSQISDTPFFTISNANPKKYIQFVKTDEQGSVSQYYIEKMDGYEKRYIFHGLSATFENANSRFNILLPYYLVTDERVDTPSTVYKLGEKYKTDSYAYQFSLIYEKSGKYNSERVNDNSFVIYGYKENDKNSSSYPKLTSPIVIAFSKENGESYVSFDIYNPYEIQYTGDLATTVYTALLDNGAAANFENVKRLVVSDDSFALYIGETSGTYSYDCKLEFYFDKLSLTRQKLVSKLDELNKLNLMEIWIANYPNENIDFIKSFPAVWYLYLPAEKDGALKDISALSNATKLEQLFAANNKISDVSAFLKMGQSFKFIDLNGNEIENVEQFSVCTNAYAIHLSNNNIKNGTTLTNLISKGALAKLSLDNNPLEKIGDFPTAVLSSNGIYYLNGEAVEMSITFNSTKFENKNFMCHYLDN